MFDILVTTGAGNVPMGGSDIWVNNFLENVVIHLNYPIVLLIDGRKPTGFKASSIPCQFVFSKEAPDLVEPILRNARKIHFLHNNYFRREQLWEYKEKFHTFFCHAYIKEIINTNIDLGLPPLSEIQLEIVKHSTQILKLPTLQKLYGEEAGLEYYNKYTDNEVICMLGKGSGKDHCARISMAYTVYLLHCLRDPLGYFGKAHGVYIDLLNLAVNAQQAQRVFFEPLKNLFVSN